MRGLVVMLFLSGAAVLLWAAPASGSLVTLFETTPLPEPGGWALPIAGLLGMYAVVRRRLLSS